jgi:hypothetical protein
MIVWSFFALFSLAIAVCADDEHKTVRRHLTADTEICHKTGNKKCPWKDLNIDADALQDHIDHGDKAGPCASTCRGCDVFDTDTCRCEFVSCSPTNSPSSSPTASPTSSPTVFCQDKAWQCGEPIVKCGDTPTEMGCYCSYITEAPFCFENIVCDTYGICSSTADCPTGTYCLPNTCCGNQCVPECPNPGVDALPKGVEDAQIGFTDLDTPCEGTVLGRCPPKL